jgi:hypothetical protein
MKNGKRETGDFKPVNAPPPPFAGFQFPVSSFRFLMLLVRVR